MHHLPNLSLTRIEVLSSQIGACRLLLQAGCTCIVLACQILQTGSSPVLFLNKIPELFQSQIFFLDYNSNTRMSGP